MKPLRKLRRKLKERGIYIKVKPETILEVLFSYFIGKLVITKNLLGSLISTGYVFAYSLLGMLVLFGVIILFIFIVYLIAGILR